MSSFKMRGSRAYNEQRYDDALTFYEQSLENKEPDEPIIIQYNIALCYFKLAKYEKCLEACDKVLSIDETYSKAYYRKIKCFE